MGVLDTIGDYQREKEQRKKDIFSYTADVYSANPLNNSATLSLDQVMNPSKTSVNRESFDSVFNPNYITAQIQADTVVQNALDQQRDLLTASSKQRNNRLQEYLNALSGTNASVQAAPTDTTRMGSSATSTTNSGLATNTVLKQLQQEFLGV